MCLFSFVWTVVVVGIYFRVYIVVELVSGYFLLDLFVLKFCTIALEFFVMFRFVLVSFGLPFNLRRKYRLYAYL